MGTLEAAAETIGGIDGRFVALALAFQLAQLVLRAGAWRNVLAAAYADRPVPRVALAAAYAAGGALNVALPARAGEAAKIALARAQIRGSALGTIAAASAVVLVFDTLVAGVLAGAAWSLGVAPAPPGLPEVAGGGHAAVLALVGAAALAGAAVALRARLHRLAAQLARGGAVLRTPRRYLRDVVSFQLAAWGCRVGVAFFLLAAFGLGPTVPLAIVVVLVGGLSTLVPLAPGGVGAHQALLVLVLHETASAAEAISFSIGMQLSVALVNTAVGLAGLMLLFGTLKPTAAARAGLLTARRR